MIIKTYEGYGRLGKDWASGSPFFAKMPSDFGWLIMDALGEKDTEEIHKKTCGIIKVLWDNRKSITGDTYLTEKCIKYKIKVSVEAELVDDKEAESIG